MTEFPGSDMFCSACGSTFAKSALLVDGTRMFYWCWECDGHGQGCLNQDHGFNGCTYGSDISWRKN